MDWPVQSASIPKLVTPTKEENPMSKIFNRFATITMIVMLIYSTHINAQAAESSKAAAAGIVYYVSTGGNDSNPGTQAQPWKTIGKAASKTVAGDTVYVRGGVYQESVTISNSGTQSSPIKILAYPGETPVIDGYYTLASNYGALLKLVGSYIQVNGFEVRYSAGMGVNLTGQHNIASNINSHHNRENGILIQGDYGIVENSQVWQNCMTNENGKSSMWASGLSAARHPNYAVIRNNVVHDNWGEGLSTYEANGTTIENNIVYNNYTTNIYISDATNILVQRNLVYETTDAVVNSGSRVGIMMGDEKYNPSSSNITVINNLVYGAYRNFYWWQGTQGGGMVNVIVAYNTFVNSRSQYGLQINSGTHQNVRIENNIVKQDGSLPVAQVAANSQLHFSNNLWSKTPPSAVVGSGDIVGDPKLISVGSSYTAEWFKLDASSPAVSKAKQITEVTSDYFSIQRDANPDIGAHEYTGASQPTFSPTPVVASPTATATLTATPTKLPATSTSTPTVTATVPSATPTKLPATSTTAPTTTLTVPSATPTGVSGSSLATATATPTATATVPSATPTKLPATSTTAPPATATMPAATATKPPVIPTSTPTATATVPPATPTKLPATSTTAPTATATMPSATPALPSATSTTAPTATATVPSATPTKLPATSTTAPTATATVPSATPTLVPATATITSTATATVPPATPTATPTTTVPTATPTAIPATPVTLPTATPQPTPTGQTPESPTRINYDNNDPAFVYSSGWAEVKNNKAYEDSFKQTARRNSSVSLTFTGQRFSVIYTAGPKYSTVDIYIDGVKVDTLSQKAVRIRYQQIWKYKGRLKPGQHELRLVFTGPRSSQINLDGVIVVK